MTQIDKGSIQYRNELIRKSIHLSSLSIPVIYYFISKQLALQMLIPLTIFSLTVDLSRYFFPKFGNYFYNFFGFMLREHEMDSAKKNLSGATYVFLSAVICIALFPKVFMITGFTILIISDTAAALIGRKYGKHKFLSKSFEGTLAFFVTACIVVLLAPKVDGSFEEYLIGFFAAAVGAIVENISYGWADDNLSIPISVAVTMWILYLIFLPQTNMYLTNFNL